jgi:hypothetical protein
MSVCVVKRSKLKRTRKVLSKKKEREKERRANEYE